jgi:hypothetical protein
MPESVTNSSNASSIPIERFGEQLCGRCGMLQRKLCIKGVGKVESKLSQNDSSETWQSQ